MIRRRTEHGMIVTARRDRRRAAAILWFLMFVLPFNYLGLGLSVDIARAVVVSRQASNAAEAAAVGGAFQFQPGTSTLNTTGANWVATATVWRAFDIKAVKSTPVYPVGVATTNHSWGGQRVQVTVKHQINGLVLPILSRITGQSDGGIRTYNLRTVRSADVCIPNRYDPTGGYCARPTGR
jgi:hypothetical protein